MSAQLTEGFFGRSSKISVTQARHLRRTATLPERLLWNELRSATPKIHRQHPLGPYVLDFYCASARIAIEVDGIAHDMGNNPARDHARDRWLEAQGLTVIRVAATDVLRDPNEIAEALLATCRTPPPRR